MQTRSLTAGISTPRNSSLFALGSQDYVVAIHENTPERCTHALLRSTISCLTRLGCVLASMLSCCCTSQPTCVRVCAVHPLAIVGVTGIIVNALNLMPIGSLDGGRIAMSAFGRKAGGVLGTLTLLLQVTTCCVRAPVCAVWSWVMLHRPRCAQPAGH